MLDFPHHGQINNQDRLIPLRLRELPIYL